MDMDGWVILQEDVKSFMGIDTWVYSNDFFDLPQEVIEEIRDEIYEEVRQNRAIRKAKEWEIRKAKELREIEKRKRVEELKKELFFEVDSPVVKRSWERGIMSSYPMEFEGIRPRIIARDEGLCPICCQPIEKHVVHHIDQDPFNNSPYNLITVCGNCHHSRGMHDTVNRSKDPHLMVYLQVLAQCRQDVIS